MAKQKGRSLLIKIGDGEESETFATLCGLTAKSISLNANAFDVTTPDCTTPGGQLWREVMTGVRSVSLSGNGRFEDSTSEERARSVLMGTGESDTVDAIANFQVIVPDFGTFTGAFHIDTMDYSGDMEDAVNYSLTLSSSGPVTFAAAT